MAAASGAQISWPSPRAGRSARAATAFARRSKARRCRSSSRAIAGSVVEARHEQMRRRDQGADAFGVESAERVQRFGHRGRAVVHAGNEMVVEVDERWELGHGWRVVGGNDRAKTSLRTRAVRSPDPPGY